ncbi:MAG: hypothetical protein LBI42_08420 [Chitinispirillales bacterium]|jgi:hypothetical protein|nr:hypothetical protein [Chitinispirillales bacterium]
MRSLVAVFAAASVCFGAYSDMAFHDLRLSEGRSFFTNNEAYNSYYLYGSPLGIFEIDSSQMSLELGYKLKSFNQAIDNLPKRDFGTHDLTLPVFRVGEPGRAFFQAFYMPDFRWNNIDYRNGSSSAQNLPIQRFGLSVAGQTQSGSFGGAFTADGYLGSSSLEESNQADFQKTTRELLGFEKLRLDFNSKVHQTLRMGAFFQVTAHVDTLYYVVKEGEYRNEDRSFQMNIPSVGGYIDFDGGDLLPVPVHSTISLQYASGRSVHTIKDGVNYPDVDALGNRDAIINDSLRFMWMAKAAVPFKGHTFKPGLLLGYANGSGKLHEPDKDNSPFKMGGILPFSHYNLGELQFGLGSGFEFLNYSDLFLEYTVTGATLKYGSFYYRYENGDRVSQGNRPNFPEQERKRTLHRISFGASTQLHNYLEMPVEITPRIAYFADGFTSGAGTNYWDIDAQFGGDQDKRYNPEYYLDHFQRTAGFTLGADICAPEKGLGGAVYMTFLSISVPGTDISASGFELGMAFTLTIPGAGR